jgi:hypothetical protein
MRLEIGAWTSRETITSQTSEKAGLDGEPYTSYVKSAALTDYSNGIAGATVYVYTDRSGTSASIQVVTRDRSMVVQRRSTGTTPTSNEEPSPISSGAAAAIMVVIFLVAVLLSVLVAVLRRSVVSGVLYFPNLVFSDSLSSHDS